MFSLERLNFLFSSAMHNVPDGDIGVAVSGGGDSLALLYLLSEWAVRNNRNIKVATIDHGLRPESKFECSYVQKISNELSVDHSILKWLGQTHGNLQKSARDARHKLLTGWSADKNLSVVLLGHTLDDNAETIIIRLSRGSGIDGLTGMSQSKNIDNLKIFRPLLKISREDLREYLRILKVTWIDEPSNFDEQFQRVKVRKLFPELKNIGLTPNKLVGLAEHMIRAKEALNLEVMSFAYKYAEQKYWGDLEIDLEAFLILAQEYQFRVLSAALRWISGNIYRPRLKSLRMLMNVINEDKAIRGFSLMGCIIKTRNRKIVITREFSALPHDEPVEAQEFIWDNKWHVKVKSQIGDHTVIGPLGRNGLTQIGNERTDKIPTHALISTVTLFEKNIVRCIPLLDYGRGLSSEIVGGSESFFKFLSTY